MKAWPESVQSPDLSGTTAADLYLALMKKSLTFLVHADKVLDIVDEGKPTFVVPTQTDVQNRAEGRDWPGVADTMIGLRRLDNLQECIEDVLRSGVRGDFIEAGTWRGGAAIFMRAVLKAHQVQDRVVWVADSFEGLPPPDPAKYPADEGDRLHAIPYLAVSLEQVRSNFARYGLLDEQVRFVRGWFSDVLPGLTGTPWAMIRIDADMYGSTMDALTSLYSGLSPGGYIIIDDYGAMAACRRAVHDFRISNRIVEEIRPIDWTGVYWRKE